ncbi:MAG: hypothetical protein A2V81_03570 [Candidatus Abawacabacteria bacterium RBG_16_42_10]|uniref:ASCH domain-containing protein n=1 Tax=Candidatus Abawacabacteria bacterium RBG_16_42_10 TaxID=1817814 RepID=A0A1F4XJZ4_9BACT|nr:MAG: hypothetical protein A2V81_03570 [Candidatus Abawacabacteria bacterium RBG_16_42_10]
MEKSSLENLVPAEHEMWLNANAFSMVKSGSKTIELRLYDEKRRKLKTGDKITFSNRTDKNEKIDTLIIDLLVFPSLEEMFNTIDGIAVGYNQDARLQEKLDNMHKYYSPEEEKLYGVCAIFVKVI